MDRSLLKELDTPSEELQRRDLLLFCVSSMKSKTKKFLGTSRADEESLHVPDEARCRLGP